MNAPWARRAAIASAVAVTAVAIAAVAYATDLVGKSRPHYPRAALPPAERQAAEQAAFEQFQQRRAAWIEAFQASGRDARDLPRAALLASYAPPKPTVAAAADAAARVVSGRVESVRFTPSGTATVFRASDGTAVELVQNGGPEPAENFVDGTLAYAENAPLLLPGDDAVLVLERGPGGTLEIQSWTGLYVVRDGRVTAVEGNPFKASVDGRTVAELLALLR